MENTPCNQKPGRLAPGGGGGTVIRCNAFCRHTFVHRKALCKHVPYRETLRELASIGSCLILHINNKCPKGGGHPNRGLNPRGFLLFGTHLAGTDPMPLSVSRLGTSRKIQKTGMFPDMCKSSNPLVLGGATTRLCSASLRGGQTAWKTAI